MSKVAIITGGASGMGLFVATGLSQRKNDTWDVHILDINADQGDQAAAKINATFHRCNVTDYATMSSIFHQIYKKHGRLDFVHANAGIGDEVDIVNGPPGLDADSDEPPPPADTTTLDVDLDAVVQTTWLAMHYFRRTRKALADEQWEGNIVMTASVAGIYTFHLQIMTAAKYGVVGLTRTLATRAYREHRVRINCICPGLVITNLTVHLNLPAEHITPPENIVSAVMMLIDGDEATDARGVKVEKGQMYGRAVEVSRNEIYFHEKPPYSYDRLALLLES